MEGQIIDLTADDNGEYIQSGGEVLNARSKRSNASVDYSDLIGQNDQPPSKQRFSMSSHFPLNRDNIQAATYVEAPVKLLATHTSQSNQEEYQSGQFSSLRDMLLIGERSMDWLIMANYMIDFDFLVDYLPEIVSIKHLVVFYGMLEGENDPSEIWKNKSDIHDSKEEDGQFRPTLDLICLRPSDPRGSRNNPLSHSIPYGVHHSKLFIFGYTDDDHQSWCRVIVHTANLRYSDIHLKAQAAYIEDFPLKVKSTEICLTSSPSANSSTGSSICDYEESLINYIESYQFHQRRDWRGSGSPGESISQLLRRFDFSSTRVVLIPSIPGYHGLYRDKLPTTLSDDNELWWMMGHWKLRHTVALYTKNDVASSAPSTLPLPLLDNPILCQFSSIGSLSEKYLRELQISMDKNLARTSLHQAISSNFRLRLQLIYPTVNDIRNSIEGYHGGASVPGTTKNVSKEFLKPLWRKWSSSCGFQQNPLCKPNHVPHMKSYCQVNATGNGLDYLVICSHNLSKAAWGEVQLARGTRKLFIRHWELGVFLSPTTLQADRLIVWNGVETNDSGGSIVCEETRIVTVPMPFNLFNPATYDNSDEPWAVDIHYREADRFGFHSAYD